MTPESRKEPQVLPHWALLSMQECFSIAEGWFQEEPSTLYDCGESHLLGENPPPDPEFYPFSFCPLEQLGAG